MRILITGAGGFAGSHLADYLLTHTQSNIWGTVLNTSLPSHLNHRATCLAVDLCDPAATREVLASVRPDRIYHLAGQAFVPQSWSDPWQTLETNIRAQLNILESCLNLELLATRILVVSSAEAYGVLAEGEVPAREENALKPHSPYGVSKIAQEMLGRSYFNSRRLPVVTVRPFNHFGPRQDTRFVASDFASQIAQIERGERKPVMCVGNLDARRDFTDVRDIARAYVAALEHGEPGDVYNVCSGAARPVRDVLDGLLAYSVVNITVEIDEARMRPSDMPILAGDYGKLAQATGWAPQISFEQSLKDILDYERKKNQ